MAQIPNEDRLLAARAAKGDEAAFGELVSRTQDMVYRLALRMTGRREDALDVSQEAYIKAWKSLPRFRLDSSFSTWIYRITANAAKDYLASRNRSDTDELPEAPSESDPVSDPEEELIRSERRKAVRDALGRLSPEHREVLLLREMEGRSYREIADMLGTEEGTVKSRINRARDALGKNLAEREQIPRLSRPTKQEPETRSCGKQKGGGA